ncbi:MAG TPA: glycosyltransferase [Anaerolineae bacterium]|nr:glycosyltransferase [Anaerolineae bacterium]
MSATVLRDDAYRQVQEIGHADLLVGIPSFNNAATIGHVVRTAAEGMVRYFPDLKPVLVNADGGSSDGTVDVVRQTEVPPKVEKIVTQYVGPSGKGSAFRTIFEIARALGVQACAAVDSDLRSITPEWIDRLAGPIVREGYGYITPLYIRHKHDATITNNITYPMTRMLYGLDVRQPIGGDFGFSGELAAWWLQQDVWDTDVARYGIDIWMTTTAIVQGFQVGQAGLGLKIHDAKDPAQALGPMFSQVVGTLFALMGRYADRWQRVTKVRPAPLIGEPPQGEPEEVPVTVSLMVDKLRAGLDEHADALAQVLSPHLLAALGDIARNDAASFAFPAETWARVVFEFAVAHHRTIIPRGQLMAAMVPLYYGRTAGLVREAEGMDSVTFEREVVQKQAATFLQLKPELLAKWSS